MNMIDYIQQEQKKEGPLGAVSGLVVWAMLVPTTMMSIMINVAQVDFITEKIYWDGTIWNWLALAVFINNLAGVIGDKNSVQIDAIFRFIDANGVESS